MMRIMLTCLGVLFLLLGGILGAFFFSQYNGTKNEEVPPPVVGEEPRSSSYQPWLLEGRGPTQAEAAAYQAGVQKYEAELNAYVQQKMQAEEAYQHALKERDDKASSYLLYLVISASVFGVLAFASLIIAIFIRSKNQEVVEKP